MMTPYALLQNKQKIRKQSLYEKIKVMDNYPKNRHLFRSATSVSHSRQNTKSLNQSCSKSSDKGGKKYEIVMRQTIRRVSTYRMSQKKSKQRSRIKNNQLLHIQSFSPKSQAKMYEGFEKGDSLSPQHYEKLDFEGLQGKKYIFTQKKNTPSDRNATSVRSSPRKIFSQPQSQQAKLKIIGNLSQRVSKKQPIKQKKIIINTPTVVSYRKQIIEQKDISSNCNVANFIRGKKKQSQVLKNLRETQKQSRISENNLYSELNTLIQEDKNSFLQYSQLQKYFGGNLKNQDQQIINSYQKNQKLQPNKTNSLKKDNSFDNNTNKNQKGALARWQFDTPQHQIFDHQYILFSP